MNVSRKNLKLTKHTLFLYRKESRIQTRSMTSDPTSITSITPNTSATSKVSGG